MVLVMLLRELSISLLNAANIKIIFYGMHPDYAYINNIEMDHVDYFKSMEQYEQSFGKICQPG